MKTRLLPLALGIALGSAALAPATLCAADLPPPIGISVGNSLADFFTATLNNSPELSIARARWSVGTARKDQATGQLLPQVNANASVSDNDRTDNATGRQTYRGERYGVSISQVLFYWQAFQARRQARLVEDQNEAEYYATLANLLTEVADQYLLVLQAEDALRSVNAELDAMSNQLKRVQALYDLQLTRVTDLYETQARFAATQANAVQLESEVTITRENLRASSGIDIGTLRRLPQAITIEPLQDPIEVWLQRTQEHNKELAARELALQAADKQVSAARGSYLPQVSLTYQYQGSNVGFDNQSLSQKVDTNYIGLNVAVPLFAGGSNSARVREAFGLRNIAEGQLRQAQMDLLARTRQAYAQVKTGEARIRAGQALAESTVTSLTAMQRGYELGSVTTVDVLNALRDRFASERDLQRARYDHIRARLALLRDSGSLSADDILDISASMETATAQ
ncbi:MAG: TolC family protein [Pseudomonadales bacterium]|jgi:outer membrane protein|nr:TolC family protein [Pseudomonadales bacterium]